MEICANRIPISRRFTDTFVSVKSFQYGNNYTGKVVIQRTKTGDAGKRRDFLTYLCLLSNCHQETQLQESYLGQPSLVCREVQSLCDSSTRCYTERHNREFIHQISLKLTETCGIEDGPVNTTVVINFPPNTSGRSKGKSQQIQAGAELW